MHRLLAVAALLMVLAVASPAYNPPPEGWLVTIREYSDPDSVSYWIDVTGDCIDQDTANDLVESEMVRNRITNEYTGLALNVDVMCLATGDGSWVYHVRPFLRRWERFGELFVFWDISLNRATIGIADTVKTIEDTVTEAVRIALTDFIYAHSQGVDSN